MSFRKANTTIKDTIVHKANAQKDKVYKEKPAIIHVLLLLGLFGLATFSQAQQEPAAEPLVKVRQDAGKLVNSVGYYTNSQKDQLMEEAGKVMSQLDHRMNQLQTQVESNWDSMSAEARVEARETMDALRSQRIEVAEWFGSLQNSSAAAWEHTKDGFSEAYGSLYDAWQKAEDEFVSGE